MEVSTEASRLRRLTLLIVLAVLFSVAWLSWRGHAQIGEQRRQLPPPTIVKQPVRFVTRAFDPAHPPADMPPFRSSDEIAQCVSDFAAQANVGGEAQRSDPTHAVLTVNQITVSLQLDVTIWVPAGVSDHVMEHEQGHRQISEHYYETADSLAEQIASTYMGRQIAISGTNLNGELHKTLQDVGAQITAEYDKQVDPNPTQLLYDSITDHGRNNVAVREAMDHAIKNVAVESDQASSPDERSPQ